MRGLLGELEQHFRRTNRAKFRGALPSVGISVNPRLRALTGRIFYDVPLIELSGYHLRQPYARDVAFQTLEHEMLHLFLDIQGLPPGHTPTFKKLATELQIPVWHSLPYPRNQTQGVVHVYECPCCGHRVMRPRRLSQLRRSACGACCRRMGDGRFDERFLMRFVETLNGSQESPTRIRNIRRAPAHQVLRPYRAA